MFKFLYISSFIKVHLTPGSKFDFQKYIKRSLEDDFKVIVGIRYISASIFNFSTMFVLFIHLFIFW